MAWRDERSSTRRRAVILILLLIGNFPAAIAYYLYLELRGAPSAQMPDWQDAQVHTVVARYPWHL